MAEVCLQISHLICGSIKIQIINFIVKSREIEDFKCFSYSVIDILEIEMPENHKIIKIKLIDMSGKVAVVYENKIHL